MLIGFQFCQKFRFCLISFHFADKNGSHTSCTHENICCNAITNNINTEVLSDLCSTFGQSKTISNLGLNLLYLKVHKFCLGHSNYFLKQLFLKVMKMVIR